MSVTRNEALNLPARVRYDAGPAHGVKVWHDAIAAQGHISRRYASRPLPLGARRDRGAGPAQTRRGDPHRSEAEMDCADALAQATHQRQVFLPAADVAHG